MSAVRGPLYGPDSITSRVVTESVLLLGGPRALLLQLANPAVAEGVADFSGFRSDPFGRLVRTLDAMNAISFGAPEAREATLAHLERVHRGVTGTLPDGTTYEASDPALLFWVHATLIDTVIQIERRYLGYLRPDERAQWYEESKLIARAFRIPDDVIPADLDAFALYMQSEFAALEVTPTARELARAILNPRVPLVPSPLWEPMRMITVDLLPRELRVGYGLPWDRNRKFVLRSSQVAARLVLPRIPRPVRNLPSAARRTRRNLVRAS